MFPHHNPLATRGMPSSPHFPWRHVECPPHLTSLGDTWHALLFNHVPSCGRYDYRPPEAPPLTSERKHKPGMVAMSERIGTLLVGTRAGNGTFSLGYLKARGTPRARVSCILRCACDPFEISGGDEWLRTRETAFTPPLAFRSRRGHNCTVRLTASWRPAADLRQNGTSMLREPFKFIALKVAATE